jgi:hypothetical protein
MILFNTKVLFGCLETNTNIIGVFIIFCLTKTSRSRVNFALQIPSHLGPAHLQGISHTWPVAVVLDNTEPCGLGVAVRARLSYQVGMWELVLTRWRGRFLTLPLVLRRAMRLCQAHSQPLPLCGQQHRTGFSRASPPNSGSWDAASQGSGHQPPSLPR